MSGLVECHSGYDYASRPVAFYWDGQRVEIEGAPGIATSVGNASPPQSEFVDALREATRQCTTPDVDLVPMLLTGASDLRFYRDVGTHAYGFSLFDDKLSLAEITTLAHGDDERVSIGSLHLTAEVYERLVRNFLGRSGSSDI